MTPWPLEAARNRAPSTKDEPAPGHPSVACVVQRSASVDVPSPVIIVSTATFWSTQASEVSNDLEPADITAGKATRIRRMGQGDERMKPRTRRILLIAAGVLVGFSALVAYRFTAWRAELRETLVANSKVMKTGLGDIEYAVVGEGMPFLSLHGTPGGYDVALASRRANPSSVGVKTVTLSRPGYLRTPLSSGKTFEQQADLVAALLDELHIDRTVVIASSGGGYAGLQFALRHPSRCIGLVMIAPAMGYEALPEGPPERNAFMLFVEDFSIWAVGDLSGKWFMKDFDENDPTQVSFVKDLATIRVPASLRFEGRRNDLFQRTDRAVDRWPLETITVPTLFIHGNADENSAYELSVQAAARIPNAKLVTIEGGDHFMPITHADKVRGAIGEFVGRLSTGNETPTQ